MTVEDIFKRYVIEPRMSRFQNVGAWLVVYDSLTGKYLLDGSSYGRSYKRFANSNEVIAYLSAP